MQKLHPVDLRAGILESLGQAEAYLHTYTMDVPQLTAKGATQRGGTKFWNPFVAPVPSVPITTVKGKERREG